MAIKKVGVVGCGLMGHGIAQVSAQSGYDVVVREVSQEKLDSGLGKIKKQLGRAVEKGRMEQSDADAVLGRIQGTLDYDDFAECDLVVEAITENLDAKLEMWRELDPIVKQEALFATNTSSLPVIDQAAATERPEHFIGLHFFNPVQVMPLLEVVQSIESSTGALEAGFEWGKSLKKTVVHAQDKAGFIVNRLLIPYLLDAIRAYEEGFGSIEQIDAAMKGGAEPPDGTVPAARLRRPRHDLLGRRDHVQRVPGAALRASAHATQADGGGPPRAQVRARLLRLLG